MEAGKCLFVLGECFEDEITNTLIEKIKTKLDELIIEGLKRHSIQFENKEDLIKFIIENCTSETDGLETTFYYSSIPFLFYSQNLDFDLIAINENIFNAGSYKFL